MRKGLVVITAVIVIGISGLAMAQINEMGKEKMGGKCCKMGMMGKEKMEDKMMGMHSMMKSMMERSVVATSDGGVVVVMGNTLTKYNKDLKIVKEVELTMDMEGMQKMMKYEKHVSDDEGYDG